MQKYYNCEVKNTTLMRQQAMHFQSDRLPALPLDFFEEGKHFYNVGVSYEERQECKQQEVVSETYGMIGRMSHKLQRKEPKENILCNCQNGQDGWSLLWAV
jgi:hypothetical protein